ncbi:MAG: esterase-like activity of phytase family protein [Sphingomonadaceae bacterium]|uniref:esterase-like activity of phytase family protein n=1 Tax=Thermaurantiacus sp. TaxID=2820283 RepID=UPI00298F2832|nr:esterase-like activity of phytase family protein [Thermaurantiacus sp.]MCS6985978.1 esterase-like activity of phytase family protein [Sphingomonadaceae bacterium]MDW8414806.1 esterase-like activity of phytase family protein [Thermaurantiacus sp.]
MARGLVEVLGAVAALGLGVGAGLWAAGTPLSVRGLEPLSLVATVVPLDPARPDRHELGPLRVLGLLQLSSTHRHFGGLSGLLHEAACGRLLAVSDAGNWVVLEPRWEGARLVGVRAAWIAPLLDPDGQPPGSKRDADAEALARDGDDVLVWFERDHRALRYRGLSACRPESLGTPAVAEVRVPQMAAWPENEGPEAAADLTGQPVVIGEGAKGQDGSVEALWRGPEGWQAFRYPVADDFAPVGADALPDGQLVVVERRFRPGLGVAVRIVQARLPPRPGGHAEVRPIAQLAPPLTVDNFEAVAVDRAAGRLLLVSDDNFNPLQRTLLLTLALPPQADAAP